MVVTRWTLSFSVERDSPLAPVWISLDGLSVHLHDLRALKSIGKLLGNPKRIDTPTANFSIPSTTRICVEMDISLDLPPKVWIGDAATGFFQNIGYENIPLFCKKCFRFGHTDTECPLATNCVPKNQVGAPVIVPVTSSLKTPAIDVIVPKVSKATKDPGTSSLGSIETALIVPKTTAAPVNDVVVPVFSDVPHAPVNDVPHAPVK
ncbi:unnamed protein product [Cuscuta europaea]|uniref:DUF4283 domain-containing protein n=1 Tax=Cuscuta europaea TaxID=41803 RepID=A0A9P1E6C7_CUSEU|nr:unnamed protein product [Cuscuta europaea]